MSDRTKAKVLEIVESYRDDMLADECEPECEDGLWLALTDVFLEEQACESA